MSSKPTTPLTQRRECPCEHDTKIPIPTQFQRSYSLRLRNSQSFPITNNNNNFVYQHDDIKNFTKIDGNFKRVDERKFHKLKVSQSFTTDSSINKECGSVPNGICGTTTTDSIIHSIENELKLCEKPPNNCSNAIKTSPGKNHHGMTLNLNTSEQGTSSSISPNSCSASQQLPRQRSPRTPHTPITSNTPKTPSGVHFTKNSASPATPPVTPERSNGYLDDDCDSLHSFSSMASGMSSMSHGHASVARNGTTFSGRKMKYVVHCSNYAGQTEDYLTPTQRAQRHVRRLRDLLMLARQDLEQKDNEILRLTKEVVELRLFKASLSSPEEGSNSSDAVTVKENNSSQGISPIVDMVDEGILKTSPRHQLHQQHNVLHQVQFLEKMTASEMQSSFGDSGHFEDSSSIHSKDMYISTQDQACGSDEEMDREKQRLIEMYDQRIEELITQRNADSDLKRSHNDRMEALLQKLAECNSKYCDLVPDYEQAKERIRELEKQLENLQKQLGEQEDKANKMYLQMYIKGQEAERIQHAEKVVNFAEKAPERVSVPELMQQLQVTQDQLENLRDISYQRDSGTTQVLLSAKEAISLWLLGARKTMYRRLIDAQQTKGKVDPEVTLQFLKSAIYYFLTDKDNSSGHLNAIESILGFTDIERMQINKARSSK